MNRILIVVRQRGHLSVASDGSACPSAGTNLRPSASDTLRLHSGHRSSPRPSSACVACRSAKPTLFFRPNQHLIRLLVKTLWLHLYLLP